VIDDFAHHPTAIAETLKALKQRNPKSRIVACFEPRSFTCQTRLHQEAYPAAFALADVAVLGPIHYSAKVASADRLDLERLRDDLEAQGVRALAVDSPETCLNWLQRSLEPRDLVVFLSSGNFYDLPEKLAGLLRRRDLADQEP
jgi:UDP-N-acetylmuramate: L-alanyl-gamma-D-glutamyl-meso-diaminopimelate ligase